ncbi:hypothetical protein [Pseudarthrobacter oxydans]|nr:hypothetical protein [Pseudarthrobacter oxydans]
MTVCGHEQNRACDRCPREHLDRLFASIGVVARQLADAGADLK